LVNFGLINNKPEKKKKKDGHRIFENEFLKYASRTEEKHRKKKKGIHFRYFVLSFSYMHTRTLT